MSDLPNLLLDGAQPSFEFDPAYLDGLDQDLFVATPGKFLEVSSAEQPLQRDADRSELDSEDDDDRDADVIKPVTGRGRQRSRYYETIQHLKEFGGYFRKRWEDGKCIQVRAGGRFRCIKCRKTIEAVKSNNGTFTACYNPLRWKRVFCWPCGEKRKNGIALKDDPSREKEVRAWLKYCKEHPEDVVTGTSDHSAQREPQPLDEDSVQAALHEATGSLLQSADQLDEVKRFLAIPRKARKKFIRRQTQKKKSKKAKKTKKTKPAKPLSVTLAMPDPTNFLTEQQEGESYADFVQRKRAKMQQLTHEVAEVLHESVPLPIRQPRSRSASPIPQSDRTLRSRAHTTEPDYDYKTPRAPPTAAVKPPSPQPVEDGNVQAIEQLIESSADDDVNNELRQAMANYMSVLSAPPSPQQQEPPQQAEETPETIIKRFTSSMRQINDRFDRLETAEYIKNSFECRPAWNELRLNVRFQRVLPGQWFSSLNALVDSVPPEQGRAALRQALNRIMDCSQYQALRDYLAAAEQAPPPSTTSEQSTEGETSTAYYKQMSRINDRFDQCDYSAYINTDVRLRKNWNELRSETRTKQIDAHEWFDRLNKLINCVPIDSGREELAKFVNSALKNKSNRALGELVTAASRVAARDASPVRKH